MLIHRRLNTYDGIMYSHLKLFFNYNTRSWMLLKCDKIEFAISVPKLAILSEIKYLGVRLLQEEQNE